MILYIQQIKKNKIFPIVISFDKKKTKKNFTLQIINKNRV